MNETLRRNLRHLESTHDDLRQNLRGHRESRPVEFQLFNEIELHKRGNSPLIAVMGVENIEALSTLRGNLRRYTAVVVEPDWARLRYLLSERDLTDLLEGTNVVFVVGDDVERLGHEIEGYYSVAMIDDVKSIPPVSKRQPAFREALNGLEQFRQSAETNVATIQEFLTEWYVYFANNLDRFLRSPRLSRYENIMEDQTVTIVGPGSSLDGATDALETLRDGWIVCVDTALPILRELGITPDIVVSVDVGEQNLRFLDDVPEDATLFCPSYMNPDALERANHTILFDTLFPPNQWLQPQVEPPGSITLNGSVASAAADFVHRMNPAECYLLGLDFAVPGLQQYSKRSRQYRETLRSLNRFTTIPGQLYDSLSERELSTASSPWGPVLTTSQYMRWRESLEAFVEESEFPYYRLGERVLPVDGIRLTKRVREVRPKTAELKTVEEDRIRDRSRLKQRITTLLDRCRTLEAELRTLDSRHRRGNSITGDWLSLAGSFGDNEEFLSYFQWEIDRVTQELQQTEQSRDESVRDCVDRQFSRWKRLLRATIEGLDSLP